MMGLQRTGIHTDMRGKVNVYQFIALQLSQDHALPLTTVESCTMTPQSILQTLGSPSELFWPMSETKCIFLCASHSWEFGEPILPPCSVFVSFHSC